MRLVVVRNKLIKESIAVAGVLAIVIVITVVVSGIHSSLETDVSQLDNQVNGLNNEYNGLKTKYDKTQANIELYHAAVQKDKEVGLYINRADLRDTLDNFHTKYNLSNFRFNISPMKDMVGQNYKRPSAALEVTEATITLEALTDIDVYALVHSIPGEFSGGTRFTGFSLVYDKPVSQEVLRTIAQDGAFPVIKATLRFNWMGIKAVDAANKKEPDQTPAEKRRRKPPNAPK